MVDSVGFEPTVPFKSTPVFKTGALNHSANYPKMEPAVGFEPTTTGLQNRSSATELCWRNYLTIKHSPQEYQFRL